MANAQTQKADPSDKAAPEKTVTAIINNSQGLELVQLPHRGLDNHKRMLLGDSVRLITGLNLIDTETLNVMRQNPSFEAKFSTLIRPSKAPEQSPERVGKPILSLGKVLPAAKPLSALPTPEALVLVEEADDELLLRFKSEESREEVRMAIIRRQELLATPPDQADG